MQATRIQPKPTKTNTRTSIQPHLTTSTHVPKRKYRKKTTSNPDKKTGRYMEGRTRTNHLLTQRELALYSLKGATPLHKKKYKSTLSSSTFEFKFAMHENTTKSQLQKSPPREQGYSQMERSAEHAFQRRPTARKLRRIWIRRKRATNGSHE
ncbi:hypothetical protein BJ508DRAFT_316381 [Ascobolus immersus RN42]|uniref:Uncharacterized protein n=1 Tax=Ascobolus immersus RN42 TaxID=1160509 RepID=A0A3N4H9C2_ASCIM|nr:hypothetical protein BJ508DRAFT_316381 [Ascobolus immersus RN42]